VPYETYSDPATRPEGCELVAGGWDHEHCGLCWERIMEEPHGQPDGYTDGRHRWLCIACFERFVSPRRIRPMNQDESSPSAPTGPSRSERVRARATVLRRNEEPLVAELRAAGFEVDSVWDLFNREEPWRKDALVPAYSQVIPILEAHLSRPYHPVVREGIVRALTDRAARDTFPLLVGEFRRTRDSQRQECERAVELISRSIPGIWPQEELESVECANWKSYRFAIANAIGAHIRKDRVPCLIELITDRRNGEARGRLIQCLSSTIRRWKIRDPEVLAALESASRDAELHKDAEEALRALRS